MRSGPVVLIVLSYLYYCVFVYLLTELHLTTQQSIFLVILTYTISCILVFPTGVVKNLRNLCWSS